MLSTTPVTRGTDLQCSKETRQQGTQKEQFVEGEGEGEWEGESGGGNIVKRSERKGRKIHH